MFYIKGSFYIKGCDKACPQLSLICTIFVFRADLSSEMAALASNLLEHFYSAINGWILMKLERKNSWRSVTMFVILCRSAIKVAYTSGRIFEKIMKRYPIFSVQKIDHQIDQKHE